MFGTQDSSRYNYYVDNWLSFGLFCAPSIFNRPSNAIVRMMARCGFHAMINYHDDFLIIRSTRAEWQIGLVTLIRLLHSLGFNVWAGVKSFLLLSALPFWELNLIPHLWLFVYPWKNYHDWIIWSMPSQQKYLALNVNCNQARSLNFACQVVHGGRTFLLRVIDCVNKLKHLSHRCRLTSDICSTAVQRPSNDARFSPVLLHSNECILPWFWSCLSWRLVCRLLGGFPRQTPPTHAYFHLTGVLLVTLSTRHFVQISVFWSFSRFLSPSAVLVPFGPTNVFS